MSSKYEIISEYESVLDAEIALIELENNEIKAYIEKDNDSVNLSFINSSINSNVRLWVNKDHLELARSVLNQSKIDDNNVSNVDLNNVIKSKIGKNEIISKSLSNTNSKKQILSVLYTLAFIMLLNGIVNFVYKSISFSKTFLINEFEGIIFTLILISPILYYHRNAHGHIKFKQLEIKLSDIVTGVILGLILSPFLKWLGYSLYTSISDILGNVIIAKGIIPYFYPNGIFEMTIAVLLLLFFSFSVELVFRHFLITSLIKILKSEFFAVILSSLIYAIYYTLYGVPSIIYSFIYALILGFIFVSMKKNLFIVTFITFTISVISLILMVV